MFLARTRWKMLAGLVMLGVVAIVALRGVQLSEHDAWTQTQSRGVLRVGMDASYPPFEWVDAEGVYQGFDVALARLLAERWELDVQFANIHFDGLYDALYTERVDLLISALPYDQMLTRDVLYSDSYFDAGQVILVSAADDSIKSSRDLTGKAIAVELGTGGHLVASRLQREEMPEISILALPELGQAAGALLRGEVEAVICDHVSALGLVQRYDLAMVNGRLTSEPYVIAVRPDSPRLMEQIQRALSDWQADGTLRALEDEWLRP